MYDDVCRHFHVINSLRVRWRENMCVEVVIKGVDVAWRIRVERRVATASRYLRVCTRKIKFRARRATETLEVARVSKNIRRTSWKAIRQSAKRCEIAPRVTCL